MFQDISKNSWILIWTKIVLYNILQKLKIKSLPWILAGAINRQNYL